MQIADAIKILSTYCANASYTLPELSYIGFSGGRAFASDGITSLSMQSPLEDEGFCVESKSLFGWTNSFPGECEHTARYADDVLSIKSDSGSDAKFATTPVSAYRIPVKHSSEGFQKLAKVRVADLSEALAYVLRRSGTDATAPWASGTTIDIRKDGEIRIYMTDNLTVASSRVKGAGVYNEGVFMVTHAAASRISDLLDLFHDDTSALLVSDGDTFGVEFAKYFLTTVDIKDAHDVKKFEEVFSQAEGLPFIEGNEDLIRALRRHNAFASSSDAATLMRWDGLSVRLTTKSNSSVIRDSVNVGNEGDHPSAEVMIRAGVLARTLQDSPLLSVTEEFVGCQADLQHYTCMIAGLES